MTEDRVIDNCMSVNRRSHPDLCWLAGLFEGEGCAHLKPDGRIILMMRMTDVDVLERACRIAGVGKVYGPYPYKDHPEWKSCWDWTVANQRDAAGLMMTLWSFMGIRRREQIEKCLAAWRAHPIYRGSKPQPRWDERLPV